MKVSRTLALIVGLALGAAIQARAATTPATQALSFKANADTYVDSSQPTVNFDTSAELRADGSPNTFILLRFAVGGVSGRKVLQARLHLAVTNKCSSGGSIHRITDNKWKESTVTFATAPAIDGPVIQTLGAVNIGQTAEFNLDGVVTADGTYNFAIDQSLSTAVGYASAVNTTAAKPTLDLVVDNSSPTQVKILQPFDGANFFLGDPVTFQATASDVVDGDITKNVVWTSNLQGALGTGGTIAVPLQQGAHTITASVTSKAGSKGSSVVHVTCGPKPVGNTPPLVTITSPLDGQTLTSDPPITLTGTATDQEDGVLTSKMVWTSDRDGALGTGGSVTKALSIGTHLITTRVTDSKGVTSTASISVMVIAPTILQFTTIADTYVDSSAPTSPFGPIPLLRVGSSPSRITLVRFAATGIGSHTVARAILRMQADASTGAASDMGGVVHAISDHTWDETRVTWNTKPAIDGPVLGTVGAIQSGKTVDFDVTNGVDGDGTYDFAISSTSIDPAIYRSREGGSPAQLLVTIAGNAPGVAITAPANQSVYFSGTKITFTGTAHDVEDGDLSAKLAWTSSLDGALGTGSIINTSSLRIGTHVIKASVTDADGLVGAGQITIRVRGANQPPAITITSPANGATTNAGTQVSLAATAADDFDGDVTSKVQWKSSVDGLLGANRTVALSEGVHTLTAQATDSDGATGTASVTFTVTPTPPAVTITAPASGAAVFAGNPVTFVGTAADAKDGNVAASLAWTSNLDGAIGTGPTFSTSALSVGTHTITASATDSGGLTGTATRTLVVRPPNAAPVLTILSPKDGSGLLAGKPVLLSATATDAENGNLSPSIKWTSSKDGVIATTGTRAVPNLSIGTHVLTASVTDLDGQTVSATVTVVVAPATLTFLPVADTYVDSSAPTKAFGTSPTLWSDGSPLKQVLFRFTVTGVGPFAVQQARLHLTADKAKTAASKAGGNVQLFSDDTWSEATTTWNNRPIIDGPTLAVNAKAIKAKQIVDFDVTTGIQGDGTYELALTTTNADEVVYASREGTTKPQLILTLAQNTAPVVAITAPADGTSAMAGVPMTFKGTATDAESGDLSARIAWSSSIDGPLGVGATLTVPALSPGQHVVTAHVADASGAAADARITVLVGHRPTVTIGAPADGAIVVTTSMPLHFTGSATDAEDGDVTPSLLWLSNVDGPLGSGGSFDVASLSVGKHTIRAIATDSTKTTGETSIAIRVRTPNVAPVVTIASPANGFTVDAGTPIAFAGSAQDDFDGNLTSQLAWSSSIDGPLFTGASKTVLLHEGVHTIHAAVTDSDHATGAADVTVTVRPTPPVVAIAKPATTDLLFAGNPIAFSASALDATEGDMSAKLVWTSSIGGQIGTGASFSVSTLAPGTHTIRAAVTDASGLVGSAQETIVVGPVDVLPQLTLLSPADGAAFFTGRTVLLKATATDSEDGDLGAAITWQSNRDGVLGTGSPLSIATLSAGTHVLTAHVADHLGAPADASATITVLPQTLAIAGDADTYVDSGAATTPFGTATSLVADGSPAKQLYLRFTVPGLGALQIARARVRLTVASGSVSASAAGGVLHSITDGTWTEAGTVWNNRPAVDGPTLATQGAVQSNQVVDFDVTSGVAAAGVYNFGLVTTNSDDVVYQSREAASGKPQLVLDLRNPNDPQLKINAPAVGSTIFSDTAAVFQATATDLQDGDLSPAIAWTSSIDGALGTGAQITHLLSTGTHAITATVSDHDGNAVTATTSIVVATRAPTQPLGNAVKDWNYGSGVEVGNTNEATAAKPEAKLWYVDGLWWGTLAIPGSNQYHIHRFDLAHNSWVDTGTLVDERPGCRQDTLWDGAKLYMTSRCVASGSQARLLRFSYDATGKTWSMDAGFPVNISGGGALSVTIAKDSTGTLWIAYVLNKVVYVNHSLGDDTAWGAQFALPFSQGKVFDDGLHARDIAAMVALQGKVGVFWSNQNDHNDYFAVHVDGADPASWTLETAGTGGKFADDHFNLKLASDGRLFALVKTNYNTSGQILDGLLIRSPAGSWSPLINVCRADFNPTRELVLLDEVQRKVYAFYSFQHAAIYYKSADMDNPVFPEGPGDPLIVDAKVADINNPTSTKQNVSPASGILVEASSPGDLSYWHNGLFQPGAGTTPSTTTTTTLPGATTTTTLPGATTTTTTPGPTTTTTLPAGTPRVTINTPADGSHLPTGQSFVFTGTATDQTDGNVSSSIQWTSSIDGGLGIGSSIAHKLSNGTHTITATVVNSHGTQGSATITLVVGP